MGRTILLVDDDQDILDILAEVFELHGYKILRATCGCEAIEVLKQEKIDFVVSDFRMPNGNGSKVLNYVNEMENKPIFYFFSGEYEVFLGDYLDHGVKEIFPKPFSFNRLLAAIEKESLAWSLKF